MLCETGSAKQSKPEWIGISAVWLSVEGGCPFKVSLDFQVHVGASRATGSSWLSISTLCLSGRGFDKVQVLI